MGALSESPTARAAYDALSAATTDIELAVACGTKTSRYVLGSIGDGFVHAGLVRQGHAVTQVILTGLEFQDANSGKDIANCDSFVPRRQSGAAFRAALNGRRLTHETWHHCTADYGGGGGHACPSAEFPECRGHVPGKDWGKCWSACQQVPLWAEVSLWGDSIAIELAWDGDFPLDAGCTGTVSMAVGSHSSSVALESGGSRRVELFLAAANARLSSTLVDEYPIGVSSDGIRDAKWVYPRPSTREVFVEAKPDRGMGCTNATCGIAMVDATVTNPHPTRHQTVRLSFSRNFNIRNSALFDAEATVPGITGLSARSGRPPPASPLGSRSSSARTGMGATRTSPSGRATTGGGGSPRRCCGSLPTRRSTSRSP